LRATIGPDGRVTDVVVLRNPHRALAKAAMEALRRWRYKPATYRGRYVPVYFTVKMSFDLR